MDAIRILLVDDHRVMRQGVRMLLELHPDFEIVAEAGAGADALKIIDATPVDLVLLELKLTDREREIIALIAEGLTNKEIGERLYMSASAVKFHISDVMQKLGVKRRAQVVFKAAGDHLI